MKLLPDAAGDLTDSQREQLTKLYDDLQAEYPRSSAARRIPLDFKVRFADSAAWQLCLTARTALHFIFRLIPYSLGCGASCDSSDILA